MRSGSKLTATATPFRNAGPPSGKPEPQPSEAGPSSSEAEPQLGGLSPGTWDALAGRHFYSSAAWLRFCATDFGSAGGAAVVHRGGRPVCVLPYARADESLFGSYNWVDLLTRSGLPAPPASGLLAGPREGYQTHLLGTRDAAADVVHAIRAVTGPGQACVAMYLPTVDAVALHRAGATPTPVLLEADAWIEVPEGGWPAWLDELSKRRRRRINEELERFRDAGYLLEEVTLGECCEQLGTLACHTLAKYGYQTRPEDELRSLRNHVRCMGDAARTTLLRTADGRLVGFCLYYMWQDTLFIRWAGFDYDHLVGAAEYFNLVYYAQIRHAARLGLRWVHAGLQSIAAKALRRARLRPLWLVDLTERSPLAAADSAIRAYNGSRYHELKADPRTAKALDEAEWRPFRELTEQGDDDYA